MAKTRPARPVWNRPRIEAARIVNRIAGGPDLVFDYFAVFSRFEYALKQAGYFRRGVRGVAEADWDSFANELRGKFKSPKNRAFRDAVAFLKREPPRKQKVESTGELVWVESKQGNGESEEKYVLRLTRAIRNNLFHGGKYPTGPVREIARNQELLVAGLVVMNQCLELDKGVKATFAP